MPVFSVKLDASGVQQGAKQAKVAVDDMSAGVKNTIDVLIRLEKQGGSAGSSMQSMSSAASGLESTIKKLAAAFALYKIAEFAKDAAMAAARYETLGVVMTQVGKNAGYSAAEMEKYSQALQKTGISLTESRQSITRLVQANLDLTKSTQLARVAQDAAVIGNLNSSEAYERLILGVQTGQVEMLRSIGINVNFEQAYAQSAATLNKNADNLTETEKAAARMNAVLLAGKDIAGTYEAAMGTAGKQIKSFDRYLEDFKVQFGEAFQPALISLVEAATIGIKALGEELKSPEAQAGLAKISGGIAEMGTSIGQNVVPAVSGLVTGLNSLVSVASSMPSWMVAALVAGKLGGAKAGAITGLATGAYALGSWIGEATGLHNGGRSTELVSFDSSRLTYGGGKSSPPSAGSSDAQAQAETEKSATRAMVEEQKRRQEALDEWYKVKADFRKKDAAAELEKLESDYKKYREVAENKAEVDKVFFSAHAEAMEKAKQKDISINEELYSLTGQQKYADKLKEIDDSILEAKKEAWRQMKLTEDEVLILAKADQDKYKEHVLGLHKDMTSAVQQAAQAQSDAISGSVEASIAAVKRLADAWSQTPEWQAYLEYLYAPGEITGREQSELAAWKQQNGGGGGSTGMAIPLSSLAADNWNSSGGSIMGGLPMGWLDGKPYYSQDDLNAAIDEKNRVMAYQIEAAESQRKAAEAADAQAKQAAEAAQKAAQEQAAEWDRTAEAYRKLGTSLSGVDTSSMFNLEKDIKGVASSVEAANSALERLKAEAGRLQGLQSGWDSLGASIAAELQGMQREGWSQADYVKEYERQNEILLSMDKGSQDALDVAQGMLDLLKSIKSTGQQSLQQAQAQTSALLGTYGAAGSAIISLKGSALSPTQDAGWYNQTYAKLYNDVSKAISGNSKDAGQILNTFAQFAQGQFLPYMQANNAGNYGTLFNSVLGDLGSLQGSAGGKLVSSGAYESIDKLNEALIGLQTGADSANYSTANLANTAGAAPNPIFAASNALASLADYTKSSANYVADAMTQLLTGINAAVQSLIEASKTAGSAPLQVAQTTAATPANTTPAKITTLEYDWIQETVEQKYMMGPKGYYDTHYVVKFHTAHSRETMADQMFSWWGGDSNAVTGPPKTPYSWVHPANSANGNIWDGSGPGLTWIAEAGQPEAAVPLTSEGIAKFTKGIGFDSKEIADAIQKAVRAELAPALFAIANNTRKVAQYAEKDDVLGALVRTS